MVKTFLTGRAVMGSFLLQEGEDYPENPVYDREATAAASEGDS